MRVLWCNGSTSRPSGSFTRLDTPPLPLAHTPRVPVSCPVLRGYELPVCLGTVPPHGASGSCVAPAQPPRRVEVLVIVVHFSELSNDYWKSSKPRDRRGRPALVNGQFIVEGSPLDLVEFHPLLNTIGIVLFPPVTHCQDCFSAAP